MEIKSEYQENSLNSDVNVRILRTEVYILRRNSNFCEKSNLFFEKTYDFEKKVWILRTQPKFWH